MMNHMLMQAKTPMHVVDLITTGEDKKFAPAGRMAAAIIKITKQKGGCLPQDLNEKGFTSQEVFDLWDMANSIAAVEMIINEKHG